MARTKQISLQLPDDLLDRLDVVRGDVPRDRWLQQAIEAALDEAGAAPTFAELVERVEVIEARLGGDSENELERLFTQAEVTEIIRKRLARDRRTRGGEPSMGGEAMPDA